MDARPCIWIALLMCFFHQSRAVDTVVYKSCSELGTIDVSMPEADNQELIIESPSQYTVSLGITVTETLDIRFNPDGTKLYPISEYFELTAKTDGSGSQLFIQLLKPIDRESGVTELQYEIQCNDKSERVSYLTTLRVKILDRNDNSPIFTAGSYSISVQEDLFSGSVVFIVSATDIDSGENKKISYSMEYSNSPHNERCKFRINEPSPGSISTSGLLYGNGAATCIFNVIATDAGSPPRSSKAQVTIQIEDLDPPMEGPAFVYPECVQDVDGYCVYPAYTTSIPTSWTGRLTLYTVPGMSEEPIQARDKDRSSPLRFYIPDTDSNKDYFTVDTTETPDGPYIGKISLNTPLAAGTYNFILDLRVEETSKSRLSATAMIYVRVMTAGEDTTPAIPTSTLSTTTGDIKGTPAPTSVSVNAAAIALGIIVAILLIIIVLLIIYIVRKRNTKEKDHYAHLSANRAPSRTYNVINNGNTSREPNGRTNEAATYELEKKTDNSPSLPARPAEEEDGAYIDIIG